MLEIQEKHGTEGYEELISAHPDVVMLHITEALEKGSVTGFIAYSYEGDRTVVYDYAAGDLMLCDGLVRSVLFKSCLKAIGKCEFMLPDEEKYGDLRKLGFLTADSRIADNIDRFMNGCENCKHNK
ncbi:MAG: hypothetical protein IKO47_03150 [Ruminococcus sp.]|nr:hypothetical protein [Ruminococcus sp.]